MKIFVRTILEIVLIKIVNTIFNKGFIEKSVDFSGQDHNANLQSHTNITKKAVRLI